MIQPTDTIKAKPSIRMRKEGGDLDGYVFTDEQHAIEWFNQGFCVTDKTYRDKIVIQVGTKSKKKCSECGHCRDKFKVQKTMTVDQFFESVK